MLFAARSASLAPSIGVDVLPTPAEEWAENTVTSIKHSADLNSLGSPSRTATPGPRVPGAYPFEGEADYSRGVALHHGYIRTQKNVMDAVMGARATAKRYLPGNLVAYLPPSSEKNSILSKDISEHGHVSVAAQNFGAANDSGDLPDHLSIVDVDSSASRHNTSEIEASYQKSHTNAEMERKPSLLSDISTRTTNGSVPSSPSRYSSQLSLTTPKTEVLHSSSEIADTTRQEVEHMETKHGHEERSVNTANDEGIVEQPDSRNNQKSVQRVPSSTDDILEQRTRSDTPIGSRYPAFLGPVDFGSDKHFSRVSDPIGVDTGSSSKPQEAQKDSPEKRGIEGSQAVEQPAVETQARTHPLAGPDVKWKGVLLEERYQKALDDNSDRQLNLGNREGIAKPAHEERRNHEGAQGGDRLNADVGLSRTSGDRGACRSRTTSVVLDKPSENHQKSQRPVSEGYTPGELASNGHTMSHRRGSSKGSRASFLDKLKGEMKVISGKLSNDGAKVEEGRRLMGRNA